MNDVRASRRRVAKFAIPTLLCCILINIPKFFESKIEYYQDEYGNQIGKKLLKYTLISLHWHFSWIRGANALKLSTYSVKGDPTP